MENKQNILRLGAMCADSVTAIEIDGGRIERRQFCGWQPLLQWDAGSGRAWFVPFRDSTGASVYVDSIEQAGAIVSNTVARLRADEENGVYHELSTYTNIGLLATTVGEAARS